MIRDYVEKRQITTHEDRVNERRVLFREHFILKNLPKYLARYLLLWILCFFLSWFLEAVFNLDEIIEYDLAKTFATSLMTISITTITFAIPTCIRTIFATYESYCSTTIRALLITRLPITLLALSAFTSLLVSLSIISGVVGNYIPVGSSSMFVVSSFWGLVCIVYLFVALEKLVYFIVRAPHAVLDKLQLTIEAERIHSQEEYQLFKERLASINDIATIVVQRSTGSDKVVTQCLQAFSLAHSNYLSVYLNESDGNVKRWHLSACRAVVSEVARIYRTACAAKNESAAAAILEEYCRMLVDATNQHCPADYFREMMSKIDKMQTYASTSIIEEIEEQAGITWFFMIAFNKPDGFGIAQAKHQSSITRTLSGALRRFTLDNNENLVVRFLQIASNADIEYDINSLTPYWHAVLDQAVFIYLSWLLENEPANVERYLSYIRNYSVQSGGEMRPVLTSTPERFEAFAERERIRGWLAAARKRRNSNSFTSEAPNDLTALIMGMDANADTPYVLAMMIELECAGLSVDSDVVPSFVRDILNNGMNAINSSSGDDETVNKIELAGIVAPMLCQDWEQDKWQHRIDESEKYVETLRGTVRPAKNDQRV